MHVSVDAKGYYRLNALDCVNYAPPSPFPFSSTKKADTEYMFQCWLTGDGEGFGRGLLREAAISVCTPAAFENCYKGTAVGTDRPGEVYPHQGNIKTQPFPHSLLVFHMCLWFNIVHYMFLLPTCQCFHLHLSYECIHVCLPLPAPVCPLLALDCP
jgi:hypothetical protein